MIGAMEEIPVHLYSVSNVTRDVANRLISVMGNNSITASIENSPYSDHLFFEELGVPSFTLIQLDERYLHTINDTYENSMDIVMMRRILDTVMLFIEI